MRCKSWRSSWVPARAAGSRVRWCPTAPSTFAPSASRRGGHGGGGWGAARDGVPRQLLPGGVRAEGGGRAKARWAPPRLYALDSVTAPARLFGETLVRGRTVADIEAWPERIARVTAADVDRAAQAVLRDDTAMTGVLLPKPSS